MYMNDNDSDIYRKFDPLVTTDTAIWTAQTNSIEQSFALKEIDLSDIFTKKILSEIFFSFENYTQAINVDTYMAINRLNGQKIRTILEVTEIAIGSGTLGSGTIAENTFWSAGMLDIMSVPLMERVAYAKESANIFKVLISGNNWSPFYMTQIDLVIGFAQTQKQSFDPSHSH